MRSFHSYLSTLSSTHLPAIWRLHSISHGWSSWCSIHYSFLQDVQYRSLMINSANYNVRLMRERKTRLPFLDSQTGVCHVTTDTLTLKDHKQTVASLKCIYPWIVIQILYFQKIILWVLFLCWRFWICTLCQNNLDSHQSFVFSLFLLGRNSPKSMQAVHECPAPHAGHRRGPAVCVPVPTLVLSEAVLHGARPSGLLILVVHC